MKALYWLLPLLLIITACNPDDEIVPDPEPNPAIAGRDLLVDNINAEISALTSSNPTENFSELAVLDQLAGTKFIGMGEASHGTKEFFEMKHKMLRYFVENHGYRGIIMEADFGECLKANEYVLNDVGNIDEVMAAMHFWVWDTKEVKSMIQWMHDYNLGKPLEEKIYYLGSDCQYMDDNLDLVEEKIALLSEATQTDIQQYLNKLNRELMEVGEFEEAAMDSMLLYADSLVLSIVEHQEEIEAASSSYEYNILKRLAEVSHQAYEVTKAYFFGDGYLYRDVYMAKNTMWWADQIGTNEKFMIWAHNYHVSNIQYDEEEFGATQGGQLRKELGEDYQIIGFSMAKGSINAVLSNVGIVPAALPSEVEFGSINELFHLAKDDNFIWIMDEDTKNDAVFDWLNQRRKWMSVGAVHPNNDNYYTEIRLFSHFDVIIHFDISTPTELID